VPKEGLFVGEIVNVTLVIGDGSLQTRHRGAVDVATEVADVMPY
jgi:hypothetical protein